MPLEDQTISTQELFFAYCNAAFPMADESGRIAWYGTPRRALFPIEGIHISRSFAKFLKHCPFTVTFDKAFRQVIEGCMRPGENWICPEIIEVFCEAHAEGWAHSCEVWEGEQLVGGIYGLAIGRIFSAESMFHRRTNASKVALSAMINQVRSLGFQVFDAQIINPHLASLGAFEISARKYEHLIDANADLPTAWSRLP